ASGSAAVHHRVVRLPGRDRDDRWIHDAVRGEGRRLRQGLGGHAIPRAHGSVDLRQLRVRSSRRSVRREAQSDDDAALVDRFARPDDRRARQVGVLAGRARDRSQFRRGADGGAAGAARTRTGRRGRALLQPDAPLVARGGGRRPIDLGTHGRRPGVSTGHRDRLPRRRRHGGSDVRHRHAHSAGRPRSRSGAPLAVYALLRAIAGIALRWFYRDIRIEGLERIPARRPLLLVVNHPNALVDALLVGWVVPRRVLITAKSTLFKNPLANLLLRSLGVLPLQRASDLPAAGGRVDPLRNRDTFRAVLAALGRGGAVLIFPEGKSHDEPALAPLKTGAARIAMQARDEGAAQRGSEL